MKYIFGKKSELSENAKSRVNFHKLFIHNLYLLLAMAKRRMILKTKFCCQLNEEEFRLLPQLYYTVEDDLTEPQIKLNKDIVSC